MNSPRALEFLLALAPSATSCASKAPQDAPVPVFEALVNGKALDGRAGLELFAPEDREAAVEGQIRQARYWGRSPADTERLEAVLARHEATDEGRRALYVELLEFNGGVITFTETQMHSGLEDLVVEGDSATAYRVGENPGGEFREEVSFVRIGTTWYLDLP